MRKKFYCQTWRSFLLTEYLGMFLCVILILFARLDIRHISEPGFSIRGVIMALIGGCTACIFILAVFSRNFNFLKKPRATANQWPSKHFVLVFLPIAIMLTINVVILFSFLIC